MPITGHATSPAPFRKADGTSLAAFADAIAPSAIGTLAHASPEGLGRGAVVAGAAAGADGATGASGAEPQAARRANARANQGKGRRAMTTI